MVEEDKVLHIDYQISLSDYRETWLTNFKKSLPNVIAFWGTAIFLSALLMIFFRNSIREFAFLGLFIALLVSILSYIYYSSYRNYISRAKKEFAHIGKSQKNIHLSFKSNDDGFDIVNEKNFSHISWETIKNVKEQDHYFIFEMGSGDFQIPKTAFQNDAEINIFRSLVQNSLRTKQIQFKP